MNNPYKDIASYSYKDSTRFKGREEDVKKFLTILRSEMCSVIYAESGIGKTSFINAGIEPVLIEQGFFPIHIIIPDYVFIKKEGSFVDIETWLVNYIKTYNENEEKAKVLDKKLTWIRIPIEIEGNNVDGNAKVKECLNKFRGNLWWLLHTYKLQIGEKIFKPYLVIDQFEEIFVKSAQYDHTDFLDDFFSMMEQTTSNSVPDIIRKGLDELAEEGAFFRINNEAEYKITFSLRKEYLSDFDYWTNDKYSISELYHNRMMLRPLTKKQAESVITKQPIEDGEVDGRVYDETLKGICDDIINKIDDKNKDIIEPVLLSIICSRLYDRASNLKKKQLDKSDLLLINITSEISAFYDSLLKKLLNIKVFKGNRDVERFENLFVADNDGHRIRKSMRDDKDLQAFVNSHINKRAESSDESSSDKSVLDHLEDVHLIRRSNVGDDTYIELIHDRFAEAIHQKQISRNKKRREKFWKYGCLAILIALLLYTIYYLCGNPEGKGGYFGYYSEITNRTVDSSGYNLNYSGFAENLRTEETLCYINRWYHLKTINVRNTRKISLNVYDCPQLTDIYLSKDVVDNANLEINGCKRVNIHIESTVDTLFIHSDSLTTLSFDINNKRYNQLPIYRKVKDSERNDSAIIIWDVLKQRAVHISSNLSKQFLFPKELIAFDSIYYYGVWYHNIKGDTTINNHEITWNLKTDNCDEIRSITLTDSVRKIKGSGFANFKNLEKIVLSDNIDTIGADAFESLSKLESIVIPKSVKYIGEDAFRGCSNLKSVIFKNEKPITISKNAFLGCSNLEYIELPDSIVSDDYPHIFGSCTNIKEVKIPHPQNSNLAIKDSVVYEKSSGIPLLFYTDYCTYSNESSGYYSENGILYKDYDNGRREMIFTPKHSNFSALTKDRQFTKSGEWIIDWGNAIIYSLKQGKELRIPALSRKPLPNLNFWLSPDSLERIYSPFPQPDCKDSILFSVFLPDSIKSRIVLYVPYGCKKYYLNHPNFYSFKSIEEEGMWRRPFNIFYAYGEMTIDFFKNVKEWFCLFVILLIVVGFVLYKLEKKVYINTHNNISHLLIIKNTLEKLGLFLLTYTILYWFVNLIILNGGNVIISNCIAIPFSFLSLYIMFSRDSLKNHWLIIYNMLKSRGRKIFIIVAGIVFICILFNQTINLFNLEKMLSCGKYSRATSLMYSRMMNKDSITSEDSALVRNVLLSSESMPLLLNKNELSDVRISRYSQDENANLLMVGKTDQVLLLDFDNHKQSEYKMPLSKSYYVNDRYICGYSNEGYSYVCKRNAYVADTLIGDYLHFADNGKFVAATTDTTCNIYELKNKAKLIKSLRTEKGTRVETYMTSRYLTIQQQNAETVKIYNLHNLNDVLEKRVEGKISSLTDNFIISYNSNIKNTYIYDNCLSLKFKLKGSYPVLLDNKDINLVTSGNGNMYFHSISSTDVKTDSVKFGCWLSKSQLIKYQNYWNWEMIKTMKDFSRSNLRFISINDKSIVFYDDSTKITHVYSRSGNLHEVLKIQGSAKIVNSDEGLYSISFIDSMSVYKDTTLLLRYPRKLSSIDLTNNHLIDRSSWREILIIPFKDPSAQYKIQDQEGHFGGGTFYIDGFIFNEYNNKLYFENFLSLSELIDKSKYLNDRQKKNLKIKMGDKKRGK